MMQPTVLLLDEPFGMLDALTRYELQEILLRLWSKNKITALMVTHDVDEALFLSDRVVMMTNGPEAEVGEILSVNFPRPRNRTDVLEHSDYYHMREFLITFLAERSHIKGEFQSKEVNSTPSSTDGLSGNDTLSVKSRPRQSLVSLVRSGK